MTPAISAIDLTKRYGPVTGLDGLSLEVERGEVFGFLGPNGAGKTTTIRLLLGLISPTSGTVAVLGQDVAKSPAAWRADVGYLPGELSLWPARTGAQTLEELALLTGRPPAWRSELLDRLQLSTSDLHRRVGGYSDGMKQKLGIVQALQCAPALALLDEATKGLDPLAQVAFYDLLADVSRRGTTVFFSSHVLPEVERVASRVAMLRRGRLATVGTVADLQRALARRAIVSFASDVDVSLLASFGKVLAASPRRVELLVDAPRVPALVTAIAALPLSDLLLESPGLEDVFMERYR